MKKNCKIYMLSIIFGLASFLSMNNAYARCGTSISFGQPWYCIYGYDHVTPKSQFETDISFFGEWWALGSGNPAKGSGNDRGSYLNDTTTDWVNDYDANCKYMPSGYNNWGNPGVDGCIVDDPERGPMITAFDDRASDSSTAFFAVACTEKTGGPDYNFDPAGNIYLTELPKPIVDSLTPAAGGVTLDLIWDHPPGGFYSDGSPFCDYESVIFGYEIYFWQGESEATNRDASVWTYTTDADGNTADNHATVFIPNPPSSGEATWVTVRMLYDSGFKSKYVGQNSIPIFGYTFSEFKLEMLNLNFSNEGPNSDSYIVGGNFILDEESDGINLLSEDVIINVGPSEITIPYDSFMVEGTTYRCQEMIDGAEVQAIFEDLGDDSWAFEIRANHIDLTGASNPDIVELAVGNDSGEASERLEGRLSLGKGIVIDHSEMPAPVENKRTLSRFSR